MSITQPKTPQTSANRPPNHSQVLQLRARPEHARRHRAQQVPAEVQRHQRGQREQRLWRDHLDAIVGELQRFEGGEAAEGGEALDAIVAQLQVDQLAGVAQRLVDGGVQLVGGQVAGFGSNRREGEIMKAKSLNSGIFILSFLISI